MKEFPTSVVLVIRSASDMKLGDMQGSRHQDTKIKSNFVIISFMFQAGKIRVR